MTTTCIRRHNSFQFSRNNIVTEVDFSSRHSDCMQNVRTMACLNIRTIDQNEFEFVA